MAKNKNNVLSILKSITPSVGYVFKEKRIRVEDYPDPAFYITMYGRSKSSRLKVGDKVVLVNNRRVSSYTCDKVVGFDEDGRAYLDNCAWCKTRGGYEDYYLVDWDLFKSALDSEFNDFLQSKFDESNKDSIRYWKERRESDENITKYTEVARKMFISDNWNLVKDNL